jgi:hypothetical protein
MIACVLLISPLSGGLEVIQLTPSMSASNLDSAPGSALGHTKYEYLVAGQQKLLSSKEKYTDFDASYWHSRGAEEDDALQCVALVTIGRPS